jgi:NAD(P)-dependent dehydrogenase (short-subunit alcohol dehydrogenase family)
MTACRAGTSRVLVTGCSSGIGRACAVAFARRGYAVVATARHPDGLGPLPVQERLALDVTDDRSVATAVAAAGDIDLLVNNAGISAWGPVEFLPIDVMRRVLETNVLGAMRVSQAVLGGMRRRRRGRIVNVSSGAVRGFPLLGVYAASKAALEVLTETLRFEVKDFGIDVLLAEPGAVVTSLSKNRTLIDITDHDYARLHERSLAVLSGMRAHPLTADEVAQSIVALAEHDHPPLRTPIGGEAQRLVAERRSVDDADYEAGVLDALGNSAP